MRVGRVEILNDLLGNQLRELLKEIARGAGIGRMVSPPGEHPTRGECDTLSGMSQFLQRLLAQLWLRCGSGAENI